MRKIQAEEPAVVEPPPPLDVEFDNCPPELQLLNMWVIIRFEAKKNKSGVVKWSKRPWSTDGKHALKWSQPNAVSSFGEVKEAYYRLNAAKDGNYYGVAARPSAHDNVMVLDLDHMVDPNGEPTQQAIDILSDFDSWTERSPSGDGLHTWFRGSQAGMKKEVFDEAGIELYHYGIIISFTGQVLEGYDILRTEKSAARVAAMRKTWREMEGRKKVARHCQTGFRVPDYGEWRASVDTHLHPFLTGGFKETVIDDRPAQVINMVCPWADEHTTGSDAASDLLFFKDDNTVGYHCFHAACSHRGYKSLVDLTDGALPHEPTLTERMNAKYAVVPRGEDIGFLEEVLKPGSIQTDFEFRKGTYLEQWFKNKQVEILTKTGMKLMTEYTIWMQSPERREFETLVFNPYGFGKKPAATKKESGYNIFGGWGVAAPAEGATCEKFLNHLDMVFTSKPQLHYFICWLKRIFEDPTSDRPGTSIVLQGGQGTGKGTISRILEDIFGKHLVRTAKLDAVVGKFNTTADACLLFWADEALFAGSKKDADSLKELISEPTIQVEYKFYTPIMVRNYMNFIFATNHEHALTLEGDDRRHMVVRLPEKDGTERESADYWQALTDERLNGGAADFLAYVLAYDTKGLDLFDPAPQTEAHFAQKIMSADYLDRWLWEMLEDGVVYAPTAGNDGIDMPLTEWKLGEPLTLLKTDFLDIANFRRRREDNRQSGPAIGRSNSYKRIRDRLGATADGRDKNIVLPPRGKVSKEKFYANSIG